MNLAVLSLHSSPCGLLGERTTGGMSVVVARWASGLAQRGHRVDVFTASGPRGAPGAPGGGVRLFRIGPEGETDRFELARRAGALADQIPGCAGGSPYDAIHSHYWVSGLVGEILAQRWGAPHLVTFHTLASVKNAVTGAEDEPAERLRAEDRLARSADRVVVSCTRAAGYLARHHGVAGAVVPLGVDRARFRPGERGVCRRSLGLPEAPPLVLFVGRPAPVKGLDRLVAAMTTLRTRRKVELAVVGGRVAGWEPPPWVHLAGAVAPEALPLWYGASDAVAVPSRYESFGLVILEALSSGRPVVTTRVGVADEVVCDGRNGTILDDPSPGPFADALDGWLRTPPDSEAARATALPWSWDRSVDRLEPLVVGATRDGEGDRRQGAGQRPGRIEASKHGPCRGRALHTPEDGS